MSSFGGQTSFGYLWLHASSRGCCLPFAPRLSSSSSWVVPTTTSLAAKVAFNTARGSSFNEQHFPQIVLPPRQSHIQHGVPTRRALQYAFETLPAFACLAQLTCLSFQTSPSRRRPIRCIGRTAPSASIPLFVPRYSWAISALPNSLPRTILLVSMSASSASTVAAPEATATRSCTASTESTLSFSTSAALAR